MSLVPILMAAEAAARHSAVRRTAYRHCRLTREPFVVASYNFPGEAAAPLAFYYGTDPFAGRLVVSAEPRNRAVRFAGINEFSKDLVGYVAPYLALEERLVGRRGAERALDVAVAAPQIAVANRATRDYLGIRLGRSLRYLGLGETHPVPEETLWAGAHLSWLAEYLHMPGQSIFIAATELLARHFASGQSAFEDENLATLLAWIENEPGSGLAVISKAERESPPFGPVADPKLDAKLEPHVQAFGRAVRASDNKTADHHRTKVENLVRGPLTEAYRATYRALHLLRAIPEAPGVQERWERDLREWGNYARRCARGLPRFKRRHDALRAARLLETWSRAAQELKIREAYDDPLIMAEHDADGVCISGTVLAVEREHFEVKSGNKRASLVPLLRILAPVQPQLLAGDDVWWTGDGRVRCEIRSIEERREGWEVGLAVLENHKGGERLPSVHAHAVFAALSSFGGPPPEGPKEIPWTHTAGASKQQDREKSADIDEAASFGEAERKAADTEDEIGPDLAPEDTLAPPVGGLTEDEVPGVLV